MVNFNLPLLFDLFTCFGNQRLPKPTKLSNSLFFFSQTELCFKTLSFAKLSSLRSFALEPLYKALPCWFSSLPTKKSLSGLKWRRRWDSNPRYARTYDGFQDRSNQPLWHSSKVIQLVTKLILQKTFLNVKGFVKISL